MFLDTGEKVLSILFSISISNRKSELIGKINQWLLCIESYIV